MTKRGAASAFDAALAERIRQALAGRDGVTEKKLFGCQCFLLHGHVCVGVWKQGLLVRLDRDDYEDAFKERFVQPFDITGKAMKGWAVVEPPGVAADAQLHAWIQRAAVFVATLPAK